SEVPPLTGEAVRVLRSPRVSAGSAELVANVDTRVENRGAGPVSVLPRTGGVIAWRGIDLRGVTGLELGASVSAREGFTGGTVELRFDSQTGPLVGTVDVTG